MHQEAERLAALEQMDIMDTAPEQQFDGITQLIQNICDVPVALVSFVDEHRQWFKSKVGLNLCETSRDIAFCDYTIEQRDIFEIPNAQDDPRFMANPLVVGEPYIRFYAGAPLRTKEGYNLGSLCVIDYKPRQLNALQREALRTLADEVVSQMELRLQKQELAQKQEEIAWYQNLVESSGEMSIVADVEGNILHGNNSITEFLGYSVEELRQHKTWEFVHPDDLPNTQEATLPASGDSSINAYIIRWRDRHGEYRWLSWTGTLRAGKWYASAQDITEQRYWQEKAEQESARSEHVLANISEAFISFDHNGKAVYLNQQAEDMLGGHRDNLVGNDMESLLRQLSLEDLHQPVYEAYKNGLETVMEAKRTRQDCWMEVRVYPKDRGALLFIRDITESRKAVNKVHLANQDLVIAQQIAGLGTLEVDTQGNGFWHNPIFKELFGFKKEESLSLKKILLRIVPQDFHYLKTSVQKAIHQQQSTQLDFRIQQRDIPEESIRYLSAILQPKKDESERLLLRCVVQDVTERKENEAALVEARNEALRSTQDKEKFLSVMSHEIRTPLNAIIGLSNLLIEEVQEPSHAESLETLKFSADNLVNLVNDILDFNKIEAQKLELADKPFDLCRVVKQVCRSLALKAEQQGIELRWHYDSQLPSNFNGDASRLSQVLNNLVNNAVKFTHEGHVALSVSQLAQDDGVYQILFEVRDTGIGIAPEKLPQLFGDYTQVHEGNQYGGTGLGLSISRKLINLMGGDIEVKSVPDEGSVFSFILTLRPSEVVLSEDVEDIVGQKPLKDHKILLVDDNAANRMVARRYLERWGAQLTMVENLNKAKMRIAEQEFHLMLLDLHLPDGDGRNFSKQLKEEDGLDIPIVAMTASAGSSVEKEAPHYRLDGVLRKPFEPGHMLRQLLHFLNPSCVDNSASTTQVEGEPSSATSEATMPLQSIDAAQLDELVDGDAAFVDELVQTFNTSLQEMADAYQDAIDRRDLSKIKETRHAYAPGLEFLGNESLNALMQQLSQLDPEEETFSSKAQAILNDIMNVRQQISEALQYWQQNQTDYASS